ncbi:MAG TPA: VOC family protein [Candidatus Baltobacteraceae bacterium]|jgi:PhnB protein|nr:VOC family protein [Candidatus Baltobacteraceae bacterium]
MAKQVNPIPQGFHSVNPFLAVNDVAQAIDFYRRAFGAKERMRLNGPNGKATHAEIEFGDSIVMLGEDAPNSGLRSPQSLGSSTVSIVLYVNDVDSTFKQATQAGARTQLPVADMFWGDRYGRVTDPFGHSWSLATHIEDVAPEEMSKRAQEAMKSQQRTATAR